MDTRMPPQPRHVPAFSDITSPAVNSLFLGLCHKLKNGAQTEQIRRLAADAEAHAHWYWATSKNNYKSTTGWIAEGVEAIKRWDEQYVLSELERKLKASGDLFKLVQDVEQEPGTKRKSEDDFVAEIEGLACMAKKLKEQRTAAI